MYINKVVYITAGISKNVHLLFVLVTLEGRSQCPHINWIVLPRTAYHTDPIIRETNLNAQYWRVTSVSYLQLQVFKGRTNSTKYIIFIFRNPDMQRKHEC